MKPLDVEGQPLYYNNGQSLLSEPTSQSPAQSLRVGTSSQSWKPSKKAVILASVGLLVVAILSFGLVFGIPGSDSSSGSQGAVTSVVSGTSKCSDLVEGPFWLYYTPKEYDITLQIQAEHLAYNADLRDSYQTAVAAKTAITFDVAHSTSCIALHADNLTFTSIQLQTSAGASAVSLCSSQDECSKAVVAVTDRQVNTTMDTNLVVIDLDGNTLQEGSQPVLTFQYAAVLAPDALPIRLGLHRSAPFAVCNGTGTDCEAQVIVATQLERTGARKVFPSIDGPAYKAVFHVTLQVPDDQSVVALSNTEEASRNPSSNAGYVDVVFKPTPIMSTYLVAIAVGKLEETSTTSPGGFFEVHGWAAAGRQDNMLEAQAAMEQALVFYEKYFDFPQPITRFDLVAIPGKTYSMENWGLLLLDERRAFHNPAVDDSAYSKFLLTDVICHEAAHQWLGNLVTCPDWMQLFVNEGLATSVEYLCLEAVAPEMPKIALNYRTGVPTSEVIGAHEGPLSVALTYAADPLLPPCYPENDFGLDEDGVAYVTYAKSGTFFGMAGNFADVGLRFYRTNETATIGIYNRVMQTIMQNFKYSTLSNYDFMKTLYDQINAGWLEKQAQGVPEQPGLKNFLDRTGWFLQAKTPEEQRAVSTNGNSTITSWMYLPVIPEVNAWKANLVNFTNMAMTLSYVGGNQSRFCNWNISADEGNEFGIGDEQMATIFSACGSPVRFSLPITLDNLTDCQTASSPYDISTIVGLDSLNGSLAQDYWVANLDGQRLWRTRYSENHLFNLLGQGSILTSCPGDDYLPGTSNDVCCADVSDVLEASAVLTDSIALGWNGQYPANWSLAAVHYLAKSPVATNSGYGLHLLMLPALEGLYRLRPLVQENAACAAKFDSFAMDIVNDTSSDIIATLSTTKTPAAATEAARDNFLERFSAAGILWRAALLEEAVATATSGRKLLQAPVVAPASTPPPISPGPTNSTDGTPTNATAPTPATTPTATTPSSAGAPVVAGNVPVAVANTTEAIVVGNASPASLQRQLCGFLTQTPLWKSYIAGTGASTNSSATVSPDLLPAIYAVAAATPTECKNTIQSAYSSSAAASKTPDVHKGVMAALWSCWMEDTDEEEAYRCLHASAIGIEPADFTETITTLATHPAKATTDSLQQQLLKHERFELMLPVRATLVATASNIYIPLWTTTVQALQGDSFIQLGPDGCRILNRLRAAVTTAELTELQKVMSGNGMSCSEDVRARVLGRSAQARRVAPTAAAQMCDYLT